jgi:hypothetical protein
MKNVLIHTILGAYMSTKDDFRKIRDKILRGLLDNSTVLVDRSVN